MSLPNWQQIDTVLLDMDGTLLDLHFDNYFWNQLVPERYAAAQAISLEDSLVELNKSFTRLRGTLNWYCTDYWSQLTGLDIMALKRECQTKIALRPQTREFLQQLRQQQKRTVIITNAHPDSVELKMQRTRLNLMVDRVISSHGYHAPKEYPEFWQALEQDEPFQKQRTVFIDDSQAVLESAAKYGIGYLVNMIKPDSQKPANSPSIFCNIEHFDELKLSTL
ncbi:MAG: GMP/IMP nucleotidase [Venatoribacter sp.]